MAFNIKPALSNMLPIFAAISKLKIHNSTIHTHTSSSNSLNPNLLSSLLQGHIPLPHILQIHAQIFKFNLHQDNLIATRLIGQYKSLRSLQVFYSLHNPNIFPFNATIRVVSEHGRENIAFSIFKMLKCKGISPNDFTFSFLLKAVLKSNDGRIVTGIHTDIVKFGYDCDGGVCNGLLVVYVKGLKDLCSAVKVFDEMPERKMGFCWTCLIGGFAQLGKSEEALGLFLRMMKENLRPEDDTMVSVLSACSNLEIEDVERWEFFFSSQDYTVSNSHRYLVDIVLVYLNAKLGNLFKSREIFDKIIESGKGSTSVIHWNTMINGYVQNGCPREALDIFKLMLANPNARPNHVTSVSVLSACAQVGDLDLGKWVHEYLKRSGRKGFLYSNTYLATALIDMYSKCGSLDNGRDVFNQMVSKDVVSFNAMINGHSVNGQGEEALKLFYRMKEFGVNSNGGTLLGVLSACNHSGLVDEGRKIFLNMVPCYSIYPDLEHYACYVDLLARVGHIEEALEVVRSMPIQPNALVWGALLQGCLKHNRVDAARDIARMFVEVDPNNSGGYVLLSNLYARDHKWGDIFEVRGLMREKGVRKDPGCSWIKINGAMHEFTVASSSHPEIQIIYSALEGFSKQILSSEP